MSRRGSQMSLIPSISSNGELEDQPLLIGADDEEDIVELRSDSSKPTVNYTVPYLVLYGITGILGIWLTITLTNVNPRIKPSQFYNQGVLDAKLIETIPADMDLHPIPGFTYAAGDEVVHMLESATQKIKIAAFYITLSDDPDPNGVGSRIFRAIEDRLKAGVLVKIVVDKMDKRNNGKDCPYFESLGAHVRYLNMSNFITNGGVLHTKLIVVDGQKFVTGSHNIDYRSYSQVMEMSILVSNAALAEDAEAIWQQLYHMAGTHLIPDFTTENFSTSINSHKRLLPDNVFLGVSPEEFNPPMRSSDLHAIQRVLTQSRDEVNITVMDYYPGLLIGKRYSSFWPSIDNYIRDAANRNVQVRMIVSCWPNHTDARVWPHLISLNALDNVEVRGFTVPQIEGQPPFSRVKHTKYMVSEHAAFVGTSNWSKDYFAADCGIGFISQNRHLLGGLERAFARDWNSQYVTTDLQNLKDTCFRQ